MISHSTCCDVCQQPETAMLCAAKAMPPRQRQELAVGAVAGVQTVSRLARQHEVSRKFVYRQAAKAQEALLEAFSPEQAGDDEVLFYLPVTKAWLRQLILGLTLICHSSIRGVVELLRDLFDFPISVGTDARKTATASSNKRWSRPERVMADKTCPASASAPTTRFSSTASPCSSVLTSASMWHPPTATF